MTTPQGPGATGGGTLEFLLRRMRNKSDFPALSGSVMRIQKVAGSENESLGSLSNEILKDVALTQKLLRMVNSASYGHAGGGSISTVSRAVALVGFAGIRNLALSLVFVEHMQDKAHAQDLQEEFLRALLAGTLAQELCASSRDTELAFIAAMFQNLGRMLTQFYLVDEARQIRELVNPGPAAGAPPEPLTETAAAVKVLGLSFEDLGLGVADSWGLPATLQRCMRRCDGEVPKRSPDQPAELMRLQVCLANDLADTVLSHSPDDVHKPLAVLAERFARALEIKPHAVLEAVERAKYKLAQFNLVLVAPAASSRAAQLLSAPTGPGAVTGDDTLAVNQLQATLASAGPSPATSHAADVLAAGIQDITQTMVEDFQLNNVLHMILETMLRAIGFRRIVFCLRNPKTNALTGRFGLGDDATRVAAAFKIPLQGGTDLFAAVCAKGADTLISDATVANIAARLPAWYTKAVNAPAFLLLPLMLKGSPVALIYADKAQPGSIALGEKELSLLRTLRNQAVVAFKQAG